MFHCILPRFPDQGSSPRHRFWMCWWRRAGFQECPPLLCPPNPAPLCFFVVSAPAWNERSAPCPREAGMPRGPEVAPAQRAQTKKRTHRPGRPDNNPALHRPWTATDASLQHWTRRRRIAPGTSRSRKIIIKFIVFWEGCTGAGLFQDAHHIVCTT